MNVPQLTRESIRRKAPGRENGYRRRFPGLPADRLEKVPSWGGASADMAYVYRPATAEELVAVFELARQRGRSVGLRGGGEATATRR
jgi:hypothetical protein